MSIYLAGNPHALTRRQKAAVIVRLLVSEGAEVPLSALSEEHQSELTEAMGRMRAVDRATLRSVVEEFVAELDSVGLSFPGGIDGALEVLEGHISAATASRLRRRALEAGGGDPWPRIAGQPVDRMLRVLQTESAEIGAVMLSKLSVARAAELLSRLPGERARRLARAIADTSRVSPENVRRIGVALIQQMEGEPEPAFDTSPVERVGAILNFSPAVTRDEVLEGLEQEDAGFAAEVRRAIFTFPDIPARIDPRDVPKIVKECEAKALVLALAAARTAGEGAGLAAEFLLANMSQRMAGQLRDEADETPPVKEADADAAFSAVISAIREIEARGELVRPGAGSPPPPAASRARRAGRATVSRHRRTLGGYAPQRRPAAGPLPQVARPAREAHHSPNLGQASTGRAGSRPADGPPGQPGTRIATPASAPPPRRRRTSPTWPLTSALA